MNTFTNRTLLNKYHYTVSSESVDVNIVGLFQNQQYSAPLDVIAIRSVTITEKNKPCFWLTIVFYGLMLFVLGSMAMEAKSEAYAWIFYGIMGTIFLIAYIAKLRRYKMFSSYKYNFPIFYKLSKQGELDAFAASMHKNKMEFLKKRLSIEHKSFPKEHLHHSLITLREGDILDDTAYAELLEYIDQLTAENIAGFRRA